MDGAGLALKRQDAGPAFDADALGAALLPHLEPLVGGAEAAALARADLRSVQSKANGRATFLHELDGAPLLYSKVFSDAAAGAESHAKLLVLWRNGFGSGARSRVVEPLGWLPGPRVLVTRAAPGVSLWDRIGARGDGDGPRLAAAWLAELHTTPLRVGPALDGTAEALRLMGRVARAVARNPAAGARVAELAAELRCRARQVQQPQPMVQIHGTYSPWHVLVSPEATIALDLDNSRPGDPAADLGEFIHWLRYGVALGPAGKASADRASASFLEAYGRERPIDAVSLAYHWSSQLMRKLVNALGKPERTQRAEERLRFYEREFIAAPGRARCL